MLKRGDTVELRKSLTGFRHLYVILTEPRADSHQVLIANITSLRPGADETVILRKGEHPYLYKDSVVFYADSMVTTVENIQAGIEEGAFHQCDPCSPELLDKIQNGILASPYTPPKAKRFFEESRALGPA